MLTIILDMLYILQSFHIFVTDNEIKFRIVSHMIGICCFRNDDKTKLDVIAQAKLSNRYCILSAITLT